MTVDPVGPAAADAGVDPADENDPQAASERRAAARHLLSKPLTCAEHDRDIFALIRRHGTVLDRWFTQRLGYRLHVDADTARLTKSGHVPDRPLRTRTDRPFHLLEYTMLSLTMAAVVAGPAVVSLRDLVADIRSAATEAGVDLVHDTGERRALVTALKWLIDHGMAMELHEQVDAYLHDDAADAVLRIRPDRVAMMHSGAVMGATDAVSVIDRAQRRHQFRPWVRSRLVEDPVVYRDELTENEWTELRRRSGDEERLLHAMFGLALETRAEGLAAIDVDDSLSDIRFPSTGTVGHAALLFIERLADVAADGAAGGAAGPVPIGDVLRIVTELVADHHKHWAADMTGSPERLVREVIELLVEMRLAVVDTGGALVVLPAAWRFRAVERAPVERAAVEQGALW